MIKVGAKMVPELLQSNACRECRGILLDVLETKFTHTMRDCLILHAHSSGALETYHLQ